MAPRISRHDLARNCRSIGIGGLSGFAAGLVIGGIGVRLAMRLAGHMTDGANRFVHTENGNEIGLITLGGTLGLALLSAIAGTFGGVIYSAVRPTLPRNVLLRSMSFGFLLLATFGFVVIDPENVDFNRFGDELVNVVTFSAVFLAVGAAIALVAELAFARAVRSSASTASMPRAMVVSFVLYLFGIAGILLALLATVSSIASRSVAIAFGTVALLIAVPLVRVWMTQPNFPGSRVSFARRIPPMLLIAAFCVGAFKTVDSIVTIVRNG